MISKIDTVLSPGRVVDAIDSTHYFYHKTGLDPIEAELEMGVWAIGAMSSRVLNWLHRVVAPNERQQFLSIDRMILMVAMEVRRL